jgi:hypothetical protein
MLIISNTADPITPIASGLLINKHMPNSSTLVVQNGPGVSFRIRAAGMWQIADIGYVASIALLVCLLYALLRRSETIGRVFLPRTVRAQPILVLAIDYWRNDVGTWCEVDIRVFPKFNDTKPTVELLSVEDRQLLDAAADVGKLMAEMRMN